MSNATQLNWLGQRFSQSEWPEGALRQMDAKVIGALFNIRNNLPATHALYPSPIYAAHVRNDDTGSRHSIDHGTRLSDATDFFCRREHAAMVWFECMKHPSINGIGVYRNSLFRGSTTDWTMFHIDTRPSSQKAVWAATRATPKDPYIYHSLNQNAQQFFLTLAKAGIWA